MSSVTDLTAVADQIQTFWSPIFTKELRESLLLGSLTTKEYEGEIKEQGNTVRVSVMKAPTGQLLDSSVDDADAFESGAVEFEKVDVQAKYRAVASFKVKELAEIQSQLDSPSAKSEMRESLMFAMQKQINDTLWRKVSPSTSSPDHLLTGDANIDAAQVRAVRTLAAKQRWSKMKGWWALLSPDYYSDVLGDTTMANGDYVGQEQNPAAVGGQIPRARYGFNMLEDDSRVSAKGLFFHPDFLLFCPQTQARFKVSDLHPLNQFGYLVSVDLVFGAELGPSGSKKHVYVTAGSTVDVDA